MSSAATSKVTVTSRADGFVIIVDDDEDVAESLTFQLEGEGYSVLHFADAHSALEHLKTHPLPDLVLFDLMMPG
jgi:two-component system phosphate regulon response regulator PhoB